MSQSRTAKAPPKTRNGSSATTSGAWPNRDCKRRGGLATSRRLHGRNIDRPSDRTLPAYVDSRAQDLREGAGVWGNPQNPAHPFPERNNCLCAKRLRGANNAETHLWWRLGRYREGFEAMRAKCCSKCLPSVRVSRIKGAPKATPPNVLARSSAILPSRPLIRRLTERRQRISRVVTIAKRSISRHFNLSPRADPQHSPL